MASSLHLLYYNSIDLTWMVSITSIYLLATAGLFTYTLNEQLSNASGYFAAMMSYMADQTNLFILYNVIISMAIVVYRVCVGLFFDRTLEGEVVKITDRLKIKLIDIIFFAYIIDLRFDFQVFLVLVLLVFLYILHTHIILRSQFLVHVHSTSTSLKQHYRVLALFLIFFFFDYQILKFSGFKMLSANIQSEALFVYYMFSTTAMLGEPFLQFIVDFYQKYTFTHFKNSDQFLAMAGLIINIPRLLIQLFLSVWVSYKFSQPFFFIISGIDNMHQLHNTFHSFSRIRKLTTAMSFLKKVKGEELDQFHDLTCTVCYDDMKDAVMLPCKHIFHEECIRQWIIKNLNHFCPKCKKEFNFDRIQEEYLPAQPQPQPEQQNFNQFRAFVVNQKNNQQRPPESNQTDENKRWQEAGLRPEQNRTYYHSPSQRPLNQRLQPQVQRESMSGSAHSPELRDQFSIINGRNEQVPTRHYIIDRPDLSQMPLEFYQAMRKRVVPVGSLPYGFPTAAVSNRTHQHMQKRKEYGKQLEVVLRLMNMNRNEQLLFL